MILTVKEWDGKKKDVVILGSMEDVISKMEIRADIVVTSPPYGVTKIPSKRGSATVRVKTEDFRYDGLKDQFTEEQYHEWLSLTLSKADLVFWNVPAKGRNHIGRHKPLGQIVWTKAGAIPFAYRGIIYAHEHVFVFGSEVHIIKPIYSHWPMVQQKLSKHPAPFPPELAMRAIKHCTLPGDLVFDPFGGSGTTAAVAKAMGRHYLTCDISEQYAEWMDERIQNTRRYL